ncbi:MAG: tRNA 2-thiouridine(34) synthase MnmA [Deltaproteobacteria bacterium]|nr:tRNA 2-thiouridine(34) synthase MnmA [Deltaproteobacteria bacterium]
MSRIVVAMSGGVDSSVAALLLQEQGHEVIGLFMRLGLEPTGAEAHVRGCCGEAAADDARRVAGQLGIRFQELDCRDALEPVVDRFCADYLAGRTPNPCIRCNRELKFGRLRRFAAAIPAAVATGHYARIETAGGRHLLRRGVDGRKDQSYLLFALGQEQLAAARFPLGELTKREVRAIARRRGLRSQDRAESQDLCFAPGGDLRALLRARAGDRIAPGPIVDSGGRLLGEHPGAPFFTVGQRRGLRLAAGAPRYVVEVDAARNTIVVGSDADLWRRGLVAGDLNWIAMERLEGPLRVTAKIRYQHAAAPALIAPLDGGRVRVTFDQPQRAVAPGQAAVFYDGDIVVGGGWIERGVW